MPNEILSQPLINALIAAGYTPRTTEEWIMSAIDYLHGGVIIPDVGWGLIGNAGTNPTTNFIGTTDIQGFSIRANSIPYLLLRPNGAVGLWAGFDAMEYDPTAAGFTYFIKSKNLFVGDECGWLVNTLRDDTGSFDNTAFGNWALRDLQNGFANCAFGIGALMHNVGEWGSVAHNPGTPFGSGYENCAFGAYAMIMNTVGFENAAFGTAALAKNISGNNNVAMGLSALQDNTIGSRNTGIGVNAGLRNTTGDDNVSMGYGAAAKRISGNANTIIGSHASVEPLSGGTHTIIGTAAGENMGSGIFSNIMLGYASGYLSAANSCMYIGTYAGRHNTVLANRFFLDNSGLGTTLADDTDKGLMYGGMFLDPATNFLKINGKIGMNTGLQGVGKMTYCADTDGFMAYTNPVANVIAGDLATINSITGSFRKDATGTTFTLTNSFITSTSKMIFQMETTGNTSGNNIRYACGAGSVVITFEDAGVATAPSKDIDVTFMVLN